MIPVAHSDIDRKIALARRPRGQGVARGKGLYYGAAGVPATGTPAANQLTLAPVDISRMCILKALVGEVTTVGSAGAVVRLGIYADDGTELWPGALVLDAGTIDGTVATNAVITLGTAVALAPGRYWVGSVVQGSPTTSPVMRVVGANGAFFMPSSTASASNIPLGAAQNSVTGALPATFTTSYGTTSAVPRVALQLT